MCQKLHKKSEVSMASLYGLINYYCSCFQYFERFFIKVNGYFKLISRTHVINVFIVPSFHTLTSNTGCKSSLPNFPLCSTFDNNLTTCTNDEVLRIDSLFVLGGQTLWHRATAMKTNVRN